MKDIFKFAIAAGLLLSAPVTAFAAQKKSDASPDFNGTLVSLEAKPGRHKVLPGSYVDWEAPAPPAPPEPVRPPAAPVVIPPSPDFVKAASMTMHPEFQIEEEPLPAPAAASSAPSAPQKSE